MDIIHNPDGFMADLRQILSQGRKRIGVLMGAGAPMSIRVNQQGMVAADGVPLIPGADDLTEIVLKSISDEKRRAAATAIKKELGKHGNIETVLSTVRLRERAIGASQINGLDAAGYAGLGTAICDSIGKIVRAPLPEQHNAYNELISWISGTLRTHPVEIFTTNYDLLLEEAFEKVRAPYFGQQYT